MKKLVRIDVDIWGGGVKAEEWPITREAGGTVYYEGQQRETRFNRFDIGKIYSSRPGTKRIYLVSEAQCPILSPAVRGAIAEILCVIDQELIDANRLRVKFAVRLDDAGFLLREVLKG